MRLTTHTRDTDRNLTAARGSRAWPIAVVIVALLICFDLDRLNNAAPVQHLYYLPIIFAAIRLGCGAGVGASLAAIALYHAASPALLSLRYQEQDFVQIILFLAVGIVTARLADDTRRLHRLATTDDLTGLHNLRSFEAWLVELLRVCRDARAPISILVLDMDRLKAINDAHGHLAGAEAVRTLGHLLAAQLPASAIACRYGGDEFAVVLPMCSAARAEGIANELRIAINTMAPELAGQPFAAGTLSISVGIACRHFDGSPSEVLKDAEAGRALFDDADRALYAAKEQGRNRVSVAP